jgi:hypothetical protein
MQSLSRRLKRGNVVMVFNTITKQNEFVEKRGTTGKRWRSAVKDKLTETADEFIGYVTAPLTKKHVNAESDKGKRHIYMSR